ncbi:MAG TPA: hypothetical protein VFE18_03985 [Phenylobacterium sp.]|jgi:hypothetical protein|uniref:hypothetical protein n=1 Tax=Phenylobacterium sp. TaxID=1871053 RepID=UPI002D6B5805|nr:hypothetical protein [Phenylobacterium sp.]HZZ67312.1 hypothetical protein [Phenylobacterium sp.]
MTDKQRTFEFVVEYVESGWMILNSPEPLGPFITKEQAVHLAEGMATVMRQMGDEVIVRVRD